MGGMQDDMAVDVAHNTKRVYRSEINDLCESVAQKYRQALIAVRGMDTAWERFHE